MAAAAGESSSPAPAPSADALKDETKVTWKRTDGSEVPGLAFGEGEGDAANLRLANHSIHC